MTIFVCRFGYVERKSLNKKAYGRVYLTPRIYCTDIIQNNTLLADDGWFPLPLDAPVANIAKGSWLQFSAYTDRDKGYSFPFICDTPYDTVIIGIDTPQWIQSILNRGYGESSSDIASVNAIFMSDYQPPKDMPDYNPIAEPDETVAFFCKPKTTAR